MSQKEFEKLLIDLVNQYEKENPGQVIGCFSVYHEWNYETMKFQANRINIGIDATDTRWQHE